jgi:GNAT superfamily N-acetyltransferase
MNSAGRDPDQQAHAEIVVRRIESKEAFVYTLTETKPELLELFDETTPGATMLFPALEGHCPADIRVDDPTSPRQCLIRNGVGVTFASRGIAQTFFEEAMADLRTTRGVGLVCDPEKPLSWALPPAEAEMERLEFRGFDPRAAGFRNALARPLADLEVRDIDRALFDRCLWRDAVLAFCGTADGFFRYGFGISLGRGDEVLAEGYAPLLGLATMEIGVMTVEAHRGNGYATQVSAYVIDRCLERGFSVAWSCETDNPASAAIARRLGFCDERTYPMLVYRSTRPRPSETAQ